VYDVVAKKFTFAISSADEFLVEIWLIVGQIFASDRGCFTLTPMLGVTPPLRISGYNLPLQKLEWLSYLTLRSHDGIFIRLDKTTGRDGRTDEQTDGRERRTDRQICRGCYSGLHCQQCERAVKIGRSAKWLTFIATFLCLLTYVLSKYRYRCCYRNISSISYRNRKVISIITILAQGYYFGLQAVILVMPLRIRNKNFFERCDRRRNQVSRHSAADFKHIVSKQSTSCHWFFVSFLVLYSCWTIAEIAGIWRK